MRLLWLSLWLAAGLGVLRPGSLAAAGTGAEVAEYSVRIWQSDEGLPLDAVHTVAQTPDGFLWVGTQGGLSRFDGVHFKLFDSNNIPGLTTRYIIGLRAARDGSLWIATRGGGAYRLKDGRFTHFGTAEGLPGDDCMGSILEDRTGAVWVGTRQGLGRFKDGRFATVSDKITRDLCEDAASNLWFATTTGVACWSNGAFLNLSGKPGGLPVIDVRAICRQPDGEIYFGAWAQVLHVVKGKAVDYLSLEGPGYNLVTAFYRDRRGTLWVGSYGGLSRVINGKPVPELSPEGLPYGTVSQIYEDNEGNIWVCAKDGLIRLKPNRVLCYTARQGLTSDNISSVLEDASGAMCIGTWGGGLSRMENGAFTTVTSGGAMPRLDLALRESADRHLWVGADFNEGLYELAEGQVRRYGSSQEASPPAVRAICDDRAGNVWVGTSEGLFRVRDGKLERFGQSFGLDKDTVRDICEDHAGNVWLATHAGLVQMRNGSCVRFNRTNGLAEDKVLALHEDAAGTLWLGTAGGGLVRMSNGVFTAYSTKAGLFNDTVTAVIEDDRGWLWMASDHGIFRVSRRNLEWYDQGRAESLTCVAYGKADGMANKFCNGVAKPSAWKSRDGRLWFATIKGLCVIDPKSEVLPAAPPPPVVIEELLTEKESWPDPVSTNGALRLPPGRGELEFRFAALAFRAPEENRYKYKLEGIDGDWVDAGRRQSAHYNNIYPGHYRFEVTACNSDGIWNNTGASLAVIILPHFWETWWFWPAIIVLALGALAAGARAAVRRRREIEHMRLRIAADLHDDIGANLASIAMLSQLAQKQPEHAGGSELSEINRIALSTINGIREIVWLINPDYDTMEEMMARMQAVAGQMLGGLAHSFNAQGVTGGRKLSLETRRNFFLIYKELLHNAAKHSGAARVDIALEEKQGALVLRVTDSGRGFDPTAQHRGNGLRNMRLRAKRIGGGLEIAAAAGGGTAATLSVPIP